MLYQLTFALACLWPVSSIDPKIEETCQFLINEVLTENCEPSLIFSLSIAAPEHIRYQELSNLMEVQALRLLYAELGSEQVDFSVGYFQMKPSFVETLEDRIRNDEALQDQYADLIGYYASELSAIRQERIDRILNVKYCKRYLMAFEQILRKEYKADLDPLSPKEQLHFMATAYNMGWGHSTKDIQTYQTRKRFPYGAGYIGEQHAFGDLSIRIFDHLNKLLCIPNH